MLRDTSLVELVHEQLNSEQLQIPTLQQAALKLVAILAKDDCHVSQVSRFITEDTALATQVLRMANSAFFTGLQKVTTIPDAVVRLGIQPLLEMATAAVQTSQYQPANKLINSYMRRLWRHTSVCSVGNRWLATRLGYKELGHEALLAGLLHDVGELFLLKLLDDVHASRASEFWLSKMVIREVLMQMHVEEGALLMQNWNIPDLYCDIIRHHHTADYDTGNVLLSMVRLVDLACKKVGVGLWRDPSIVLATTPEARSLGVSEILLAELEILLEDTAALHNEMRAG